MTRLTHQDISQIPPRLAAHDTQLRAATGKGLLGIACHAWDLDEAPAQKALEKLTTQVIPVTAGQGIITDFSATVVGILTFLGLPTRMAPEPDVQGLARTFESQAQALFMADDYQFMGVHLPTRTVADNTQNTGKVYAAALDLAANTIAGKTALVMGCGPVGAAAALELARRGAKLLLHDIDPARALAVKLSLPKASEIALAPDLEPALELAPYILEATPEAQTLPAKFLTPAHVLAAPGVPLAIDEKGQEILGPRLIHDKLELGVAAMAVELIKPALKP